MKFVLDSSVGLVSTKPVAHRESIARIQDAADKAAKGIRDPEDMRKAAEEMDKIREEIRRCEGDLNVGLDAIRELRDS